MNWLGLLVIVAEHVDYFGKLPNSQSMFSKFVMGASHPEPRPVAPRLDFDDLAEKLDGFDVVSAGKGSFGSLRTRRMDLDSCLVRITETGKMLWVRQFGTGGWDGIWDMARFVDGSGDIFAAGCQYPSGPFCQAFCRRYSPEGKLVWIKEFRKRGVSGGTCGRAVAIDSANNCYHAGVTSADNFAVNNGTQNVFIVRFDEAKDELAGP
jgi:hypothetical protein